MNRGSADGRLDAVEDDDEQGVRELRAGDDERHRVCWPVTHRSACLAVVTTARGGPDAATTARGGRCPRVSEGGGEQESARGGRATDGAGGGGS